MSKQTITLGVLSFNDGPLMEKLLKQVSPFVNEIIVLDSNSTDDSVNIAKSFGAHIIQFPFCDSFAALRNVIIANATCDYILMLDCDETLQDPIKFFNYDLNADMYWLPRKNYIDDVLINPDDNDLQGRLFKNNKKIKYFRKVHELLTGYKTVETLPTGIIHNKTTEKYINNHIKYKNILNSEGKNMTQIDMSNDTLFNGWYQYERFPNGDASRWCSNNGTVAFECNNPMTRAIGIYISTVGRFKKCRFTVTSGDKIVGQLEAEPEVGTIYVPVSLSENSPGEFLLTIKCWDEREFVSDPRTLGLFIDRIWFEAPAVTGTLKVLWDPAVAFTVSGDPRDNGIMPCILGSNYWETATQMVMDRFIKPDFVCLDVGANIGAVALPMALKAKKVYAFEVGNIPFGYVKNNVIENGIDNIELVRAAISDTTEKLYYHYIFPNVGGSFVSTDKQICEGLIEEINGITLDSMIDTFESVDFIKMDIEGYELRALHGATEILKKFKPLLFIEFNPVAFQNMHGEPIKPLWDFLAKEYKYIYVVREDGLRRVKNYKEAVAGIDMTTRTLEDLLCSHVLIKE